MIEFENSTVTCDLNNKVSNEMCIVHDACAQVEGGG